MPGPTRTARSSSSSTRTPTLPPNYTIWGTVTSGLDVVERVAAAGVEGGLFDGPPALPVTIETATVAAQ